MKEEFKMHYAAVRGLMQKFRFFQYLSCLKNHMATESLNGNQLSKFAMIYASVRQMKPIFYNFHIKHSKIQQYDKLIAQINIKFTSSSKLLYCIDEQVILFQEANVIGNIPLNYGWIVDKSLNELEEMYSKQNNGIAEQNRNMINIIYKYLDKISEAVKNSGFSDELEKLHLSRISRMKTEPASDLPDALQRILILNQFLWQCGHRLNGLGRLDKILERFPVNKDSYNDIKEFLQVLHRHYTFKSSAMRGDTGQIILLGGIEDTGTYFSNPYTYMILKAIGELALPDPKILLRSSLEMPKTLLSAAIECLQKKCGSPLLSNDDIIIPNLEKFGYSHKDACNYGVSACWEPLVIGKSLEQNNITNIQFSAAFEKMINDRSFLNCSNFNEVINLYYSHLDKQIMGILDSINQLKWAKAPLFTLFTDGCITAERDISEGGAAYNNYGLLSVGLASAIDSLLNIKKNIFEYKIFSLKNLSDMLKKNFRGYEKYRRLLEQPEEFFGMDNDFVVDLTKRILNHVSNTLSEYKNPFGGKIKFGLSSPGYIIMGKQTGATADGRKAGMPFSTHISSSRSLSPTVLVRFAGLLNYAGNKANGNVVDLIMPSAAWDNKKLLDFLNGSLCAGIFQMQFNFVSYAQLSDAKMHPEKYPNLIVRVWGFSAYFNDLPEEYKDVLILRARESEYLL